MQDRPHLGTVPVLPERDHVVRAAGVVIEGVLGQHELRMALELADVHRLPSCEIRIRTIVSVIFNLLAKVCIHVSLSPSAVNFKRYNSLIFCPISCVCVRLQM